MIKLTIKRKLVGTVSGLIAFFGVMTVISIFLYTKSILFNFQKQNILLNTEIMAGEIGKVFANSFYIAEVISNTTQVVEYLKTGSESMRDNLIEDDVLGRVNMNGRYSAIYLMDKEGLTLISTDKSFEGKNYGFRDYFRQAISGQAAIDVSIGVTSGELGYYFASPVRDHEQVVGVLVLKMRPEFITEAIGKNRGKIKNIESFLIDEYGVVVDSSRENAKFQSLGGLVPEKREELLIKKRYAQREIGELGYSEVMASLETVTEPMIFSSYNEKGGMKGILGVTKVQGAEFYYMTEMSTEEMEGVAGRVGWLLSLFVGVLAGMAAIFSGFFVQKLIRPIVLLKKQTEMVAGGVLEQKLEIKTGDELEELAESFNQMTTKLKESYQNIEQKVEERTEQLQRLNKHMVGRELKMRELKKQIKEQK